MAYDLAVIIHLMLKAGYLAISVIGKVENYKTITLLIAETNLLSFLSVFTFLWKYTIYIQESAHFMSVQWQEFSKTEHTCVTHMQFKK